MSLYRCRVGGRVFEWDDTDTKGDGEGGVQDNESDIDGDSDGNIGDGSAEYEDGSDDERDDDIDGCGQGDNVTASIVRG